MNNCTLRPLGPGTVIVPTSDHPRFNKFFRDLMVQASVLPQGSTVRWSQTPDIAANINDGIRRMQGEWAWIIGDDHVWGHDTIQRLAHHGMPVVAAFCLKRTPPFGTVMFDERMAELKPEKGQTGLLRVHAVGSAGMFIRRDVLDRMGAPWFENRGHGSERQAEDLVFCEKLRAMGVPIYVDLDTTIGHIANAEVWPHHSDEQGWGYRINLRQTASLL